MKIIDLKKDCPFWVVELKSDEDAKKLGSRSVSLKTIIKLWGCAQTIADLHEEIKSYPLDIVKPYLCKERSFRVQVTTYNTSFTIKEKISKIEMFDYLPAEGPVCLSNPDSTLHYIEDYGLDPNNVPQLPLCYYFGVWVRPLPNIYYLISL